MTSFIAAGGSGRSASFIPAVPAAWSVTTIAFIVHLLCVWSSSLAQRCVPPVIRQHQDLQFLLYHRAMAALPVDVDRAGRTPLAGQIYQAIRRTIETGRLASGARLPSWRDLAAQLGVSRGTVRVAYQCLDRRSIRD